MSQVAYLTPGKREQTKLANRQAILDAARETFAELGFEAATVRDIIRRTTLSVGAFYNYFRSKEEVFDALSDEGAARFRPILQAQSAQATDFASYLRAGVRAYYDFVLQDREAFLAGRVPDDFPHTRTTPEMQAVYAEVRSTLDRVMERDAALAVDLDYLAAAVIAVAREIGDEMLRRRPVDAEGAAEFVASLILGGVGALPRKKD